jgi:phosphoenolpyruvate carboxylase
VRRRPASSWARWWRACRSRRRPCWCAPSRPIFASSNLAEDNQRVRRIRAHEHEAFPALRRGSLREAIGIIADRGAGAARLQELLAQAEVRLVLTSHPTEARRRTTVAKLARVFAKVRELDERQLGPEGLARRRTQLAATIQELWRCDEIRAVSPSVLDEVRAELVYFQSTLLDVVPRLSRRRRRGCVSRCRDCGAAVSFVWLVDRR